MKDGGVRDLESIFLYQEGGVGVVHKQAYGGYRSLQEPSDCFPFQSARVVCRCSSSVSNFTGGNSRFAKIPHLLNLS